MLLLAGIIGLSYTFFTPFCGLMFDCGCDFLWETGGRMCNVYTSAAGSHCPFCSTGAWGKMIPRGTVWLTQTAVVLVPLNISWKGRAALGVMAFIGTAMLIGSIFLLVTGYPTYFGMGH